MIINKRKYICMIYNDGQYDILHDILHDII